MTDKLPPNLLALFAPRPPLRWVPAPDHAPQERKTHAITGLGEYLPALAAYKETDVYVPTESWLEMRDRKKLEKKAKQEQLLAEPYKSTEDQNIRGDPFKTLIAARLSYDVNEHDLEKEFGRFGPIERIRIITDTHAHERPNKKKKPHRGYAFVVFEREKDMRAALDGCDGIRIKDRRIKVVVWVAEVIRKLQPLDQPVRADLVAASAAAMGLVAAKASEEDSKEAVDAEEAFAAEIVGVSEAAEIVEALAEVAIVALVSKTAMVPLPTLQLAPVVLVMVVAAAVSETAVEETAVVEETEVMTEAVTVTDMAVGMTHVAAAHMMTDLADLVTEAVTVADSATETDEAVPTMNQFAADETSATATVPETTTAASVDTKAATKTRESSGATKCALIETKVICLGGYLMSSVFHTYFPTFLLPFATKGKQG
ncbi:Uu.00g004420.m01.CDS01 [Anthostomella pinea]|uniref:Uu.00g004420.m01.CDS01 n=1 Tax=Anthostomella pinea TaxID=933095 RepID=A0AAI8VKN0_9PEZI|nr:Uu.00g004420.m01.CDS01 [Anthostomella pinea]